MLVATSTLVITLAINSLLLLQDLQDVESSNTILEPSSSYSNYNQQALKVKHSLIQIVEKTVADKRIPPNIIFISDYDYCNENISKFLNSYWIQYSITSMTIEHLSYSVNDSLNGFPDYNLWISLIEDVDKIIYILGHNKFNPAIKMILFTCTSCSDIARKFLDKFPNVNYMIIDRNFNTCISRSIDLNGTHLEIAAFHCPPYVYTRKGTVQDGLEFCILKEITRKLNWTQRYTIVDPTTVGSYYTKVIDTVINRAADIGICSQWMSVIRNRSMDITYPYSDVCVTFLVPKPKLLTKITFVFQPLRLTLWLLWLSFITIVIPFLTHWVTGICFVHCLLEVVRVSTLNVLPLKYLHKSSVHRILFYSWCVTCLLMNTAYSTGFTSLLTLPRYTKPIHTVKDMIDQGIKWGGPKWGSLDTMIDTKRATLSGFMDNYRVINRTDYNSLLRTENYAIFAKVLRGFYLEETESLDEYGRTHLMLLKKCSLSSHVAFILQKNSPYKHIVDQYIRRLVETGLVAHWHSRIRYANKLKYMDNFYVSYVKMPWEQQEKKKFTMEKLQGAFYVLLIGCCLAFFAFGLELCNVLK